VTVTALLHHTGIYLNGAFVLITGISVDDLVIQNLMILQNAYQTFCCYLVVRNLYIVSS